MFLKNYTSEVPVSQTIYRIEQTLIKCGVQSISKEYGTRAEVVALQFRIHDNGKEFTVRLPANREKAQQAMWLNYADGQKLSPDGQTVWGSNLKKKKRSDFADQAERTAWKIVQDWVEVQMSMIQMKQAEPVEVFLPYVWDEQSHSTVFGRLKSGGFRALLPEKAGDNQTTGLQNHHET